MAEEKRQGKGGGGKVRVQYYRSAIGFSKEQKEVVRSLGFTKLNQVLERPDTPATRGAVQKVPHLIRIIE
ncbi:MAG TPA: 50S ribosomal protein L30 [Pyrinomonadaceae bacterium]|nr:50S ribosomal protein L30 [Pyrinomonadaceae bacterium]